MPRDLLNDHPTKTLIQNYQVSWRQARTKDGEACSYSGRVAEEKDHVLSRAVLG